MRTNRVRLPIRTYDAPMHTHGGASHVQGEPTESRKHPRRVYVPLPKSTHRLGVAGRVGADEVRLRGHRTGQPFMSGGQFEFVHPPACTMRRTPVWDFARVDELTKSRNQAKPHWRFLLPRLCLPRLRCARPPRTCRRAGSARAALTTRYTRRETRIR